MAIQRTHVKVRNVQETVERVLQSNPSARENDYILYTGYLKECGYSSTMSFANVAKLIQTGELSSIETVSRLRRKLQSDKNHLCASV